MEKKTCIPLFAEESVDSSETQFPGVYLG